MWYNNKVAHKRLARNTSRGSLTIEQQEIKVQAKLVIENLEISLKKESLNLSRIRAHTQQSMRAKQARQRILTAKQFEYNLLESLILAQDERWRRA